MLALGVRVCYSGITHNLQDKTMNDIKDPRFLNDIKYICVRFLQSSGKRDIKITLVDTITRAAALDLMALIEKGGEGEIFRVTGETLNNGHI